MLQSMLSLMQLKRKPYNLFLVTALALIPFAFFLFLRNTVVDIHLHDTYFVIAADQVLWALSSLSLIVWGSYLIANNVLYSTALTWTHVIVTILAILTFIPTLFIGDAILNSLPRRYVDYSEWNAFERYASWSNFISVVIAILILAQALFFINIVTGLLSKVFRRRV